MTALTTVADLETRLGVPVGSLADEDLARANAVLADASEVVRAAGNPQWTDAEGVKPAPPLAVLATVRLARRFWDNPEGLSYEALGDHVTSRRAADEFLTADERALVYSAAGFSGGSYATST